MSYKTLGTLVEEGCKRIGRDDDDLEAEVLKGVLNWLRQTYLSWPWPFLHESRAQLSLPTGTTALTIGGGNGGITPEIQKVIDPIWVQTSDGGIRAMARIRQLTGGNDTHEEERVQSSATWRGLPSVFRVRPSTSTPGVWSLVPMPYPDKDYLISFDYIVLPANITSTDKPIYPNDLTIVQAASVEALLYTNGHDDAGYQDAIQVLARRTAEDRTRFGSAPGINDVIQLDGNVFR